MATQSTFTYIPAAEVWPKNGRPLFREVRNPYFLQVTEEILDEIVRRVVEKLDPEKIILFGSYAYGQPTVDSDVDLLVIIDSPLNQSQRALEVSRQIRPRPFPVDIITKTPTEVAEALAKGNFFIKEIVNQGRVLYDCMLNLDEHSSNPSQVV